MVVGCLLFVVFVVSLLLDGCFCVVRCSLLRCLLLVACFLLCVYGLLFVAWCVLYAGFCLLFGCSWLLAVRSLLFVCLCVCVLMCLFVSCLLRAGGCLLCVACCVVLNACLSVCCHVSVVVCFVVGYAVCCL